MLRLPDISPRILDTYAKRGVVRLGRVLDADGLARLIAAIDSLRDTYGFNESGLIIHDTWRRHDACAEAINSPVLGELACRLMNRGEATLFQDNMVWKRPGSGRIEWHQDYSYQPVSAPEGVSFWLSLDHSDPESGCVHYISGTHLKGERAPADFVAGAGQPQRDDLPRMDIETHRAAVVPWYTEPGELLAHHPLIWHMSPANRSQRHRRAISINWLDSQVRWRPSQAPHPYNYALAPSDGDPLPPDRFPRFMLTEGTTGLR